MKCNDYVCRASCELCIVYYTFLLCAINCHDGLWSTKPLCIYEHVCVYSRNPLSCWQFVQVCAIKAYIMAFWIYGYRISSITSRPRITRADISLAPQHSYSQLMSPGISRSSQVTGIYTMNGWYQRRNRTLIMPGTCVLQTSFSALNWWRSLGSCHSRGSGQLLRNLWRQTALKTAASTV